MVTAMLIFSILLVVSYVGTAIWSKGELPESVSAMVYDLPKAGQWLWTLWLFLVAFCIAPALLEAIPESWKFVGFFTVACLAFCAAMPLVKNEKNTAHYALAIAAGILSQICVAFISPWWLIAWPLYVAVISFPVFPWTVEKRISGKGVFLIECVCWLTLTACLIVSRI